MKLNLGKPREVLKTEGGALRLWAMAEEAMGVGACELELRDNGLLLPAYADVPKVGYITRGTQLQARHSHGYGYGYGYGREKILSGFLQSLECARLDLLSETESRVRVWSRPLAETESRVRVWIRHLAEAESRVRVWIRPLAETASRVRVWIRLLSETESRVRVWILSNSRVRVWMTSVRD
jgi:hypothetical protein